MDQPPAGDNYEQEYAEAALLIYDATTTLFRMRHVAARLGADTSMELQEYQLTDQELDQTGVIFNSCLIDAPDSMLVMVAKQHAVVGRPYERVAVIIKILAGDVVSEYQIAIVPGQMDEFILCKSIVRATNVTSESETDESHAQTIRNEIIYNNVKLDDTDITALRDTLSYLIDQTQNTN